MFVRFSLFYDCENNYIVNTYDSKNMRTDAQCYYQGKVCVIFPLFRSSCRISCLVMFLSSADRCVIQSSLCAQFRIFSKQIEEIIMKGVNQFDFINIDKITKVDRLQGNCRI